MLKRELYMKKGNECEPEGRDDRRKLYKFDTHKELNKQKG